MEVVIISKGKYEEMVGKLNLLSDRVNEIIGKREKGKLSRWMDNQEVCQRHAGLLADRTQDFLQAGGCSKYRPACGGQAQRCRMAWPDNLISRV